MLTNWILQHFGAVYLDMFLLLGVALVVSSIGFYRLLYFINIGYAFAIVGMIVLMLVRHLESLSFVSGVQNGLLALWGLRLGIYLVRREFQAAYSKQKTEIHESFADVPWGVRVLIWISVSLLYVLMFSPSLSRLTEISASPSWFLVFSQGAGLLLMGGGLLMETIADKQKSDFKTERPRDYCDTGLYRLVRCPNYLGEIIFWVGNWVVGIMFYTTPLHWIVSSLGAVCIVLIMMGSTKRLESAQDGRYGDRSAYLQYIRTVPVLFPFVPVYSLKKVRVFLE